MKILINLVGLSHHDVGNGLHSFEKCYQSLFDKVVIPLEEKGHEVDFFLKTYETEKQNKIESIVKNAVECEREFIIEAIPCKLIGMDSTKMSQYIEYVADRLMKQLGYKPIWNSENPFDFMENISLDGKTNFFEKRVGEYSKFSNQGNITFDDDF